MLLNYIWLPAHAFGDEMHELPTEKIDYIRFKFHVSNRFALQKISRAITLNSKKK